MKFFQMIRPYLTRYTCIRYYLMIFSNFKKQMSMTSKMKTTPKMKMTSKIKTMLFRRLYPAQAYTISVVLVDSWNLC